MQNIRFIKALRSYPFIKSCTGGAYIMQNIRFIKALSAAYNAGNNS